MPKSQSEALSRLRVPARGTQQRERAGTEEREQDQGGQASREVCSRASDVRSAGVPNSGGDQGVRAMPGGMGGGRRAAAGSWGALVTCKKVHGTPFEGALACAPPSLMRMWCVCGKPFCVECPPSKYRIEDKSRRLRNRQKRLLDSFGTVCAVEVAGHAGRTPASRPMPPEAAAPGQHEAEHGRAKGGISAASWQDMEGRGV